MVEAILNQPQFQDAEKAHRPGLYKCSDCREQFSVTVGTLFADSKVPLNKWLQACYLMSASKKGIASKQLERMLGVTYKTARFMSHRIREAMTSNGGGFFGGNGDAVEVDETYWGNTGKQRKGFVRFSKRKYMKDRG